MKRNWLAILHKFAQSPLLNFLSGLILLVTGMLECVATLVESWYRIPIGAHHGIAIFGFLQMIRALPDTMKGLGFIEAGEAQAGVSPRINGKASAQGKRIKVCLKQDCRRDLVKVMASNE
ncbi:MAG: hypothetical protein SFV81_24705 [Pirellulaceae bacterium]|nr:hypothetical protein [Pirellulaceae bacterium]